MNDIEVGKKYDVDHSRKGRFRIQVDDVSGTFVTGTIIKGRARFLSEPNRGPGDVIAFSTDSKLVTLTPAGE